MLSPQNVIQECIPVGCSAHLWGDGVCRGVSGQGGLPKGGVHLPPVDRMTDACENITFPQLLLRTVTSKSRRLIPC